VELVVPGLTGGSCVCPHRQDCGSCRGGLHGLASRGHGSNTVRCDVALRNANFITSLMELTFALVHTVNLSQLTLVYIQSGLVNARYIRYSVQMAVTNATASAWANSTRTPSTGRQKTDETTNSSKFNITLLQCCAAFACVVQCTRWWCSRYISNSS
jgi:hypothetical protein